MKRTVIAGVLAAVLCVASLGRAWAGEVDVLVSKLVDKGVLTASEGQIILDETKAEVAKQTAKGENAALPAWVQSIKLKGDFRLRYQNDYTNNTKDDRSRARIRLRLGLEGNVNDKLMVGFGLATGLSDGSKDAARSTNATLEKAFSKKAIALDYAYAKYAPYGWLEIIGGKMKNPIWEPTDMVWDTDINPEGASINLKKTIDSKLDVFLNTGVFVLGESGSAGENDDPMMYILQPGFNYKVNDTISVKGAFTYNNSSNVKGRVLSGTGGGNTLSGGFLKNDYVVVGPDMQVDIDAPFKATGLPFVKDIGNLGVFGEYVNNTLVTDENNGFALGFNLGAKKVAAFGDWQFRYLYVMLEKDAVLDILPDSDRKGGATGIRSHEGILNFGLGKNTFLGLDVYRSWSITNSKTAETVAQLDWNLKF